ncbi:MAG: glycosyltransferase family 1 protein [Bacteroidota bacterium]
MSERHLHIVSFDVPYPPNYGGVIDVFYKIRELHGKGIRLHLHIIEYPGRNRAPELNAYCDEIFYYPRLTGIRSFISLIPYIVKSRRSEEMIQNLLKDKHPILFEGLHSCYYINDSRLNDRMLVYRESNIEHRYYFNLFKAEHHLGKKAYFLAESLKLLLFQHKLKHAGAMFVVSEEDTAYLNKRFPEQKVHYLPSFHANSEINIPEGKGEYTLYHGNIEVPENEAAAAFLINKVFAGSAHKLIIAGMNPPQRIVQLASRYENISIIANPGDEELFSLIRNAHVNILVTFQATGLKLKLLNTLFNGRHCLVNPPMLNGTGLDAMCHIASTAAELTGKLDELKNKSFTHADASARRKILLNAYSNNLNADRMIGIIFGA